MKWVKPTIVITA